MINSFYSAFATAQNERIGSIRHRTLCADVSENSPAIGCNRDKGARDDFIDELAGKTVRVVRKRAHASSPGSAGGGPGNGGASGGRHRLRTRQFHRSTGGPPARRNGQRYGQFRRHDRGG